MTMKRFCATALLLLWSLCALAVQKSGTIVYINGSKFYVHTVQPGETLYGLSKAYEVGEKVILQHNPAAAQGLRAGESIKIPFVSDVPQPKSDRKLRKTFDIHTVTQGETLYGISRKYEIPIQTVIEDNPNLDPAHLRLGERILIRKKEIGSEDEAGTREQWEAYRNSLNSVAEEGFAYHIVKPGETFYSLSRRFGITEDRLGTLNGGLKPADLKAGAIIKLPTADVPATAEQPADTLTVRPPAEKLLTLAPDAALRLSLLLPATTDGRPNASYTEFYQGFLLGEHGLYDKRFMYEESFRTPLIMAWRGHIRPGTVCRELVQNIDYAPTLLDAAGVGVPDGMDGVSLQPLFRSGKARGWRTSLYYQYYDYPAVGSVRAHYGIRTDRYKLIHWFGPGADGDPDIDFWELYDLRKDPCEVHNVYEERGYLPIRRELARLLAEKRGELGIR